MIPFQNSKPSNGQNTNDHVTAEKIELLVQQRYNITIPSLYLEYFTQENSDFDLNDLKSFYSQFGEVIEVIIKGKISVVLYKNFFDAEVCREFLLNEKNFKENMKKNSSVRWFDYEKDINILPPEVKNLFEKESDIDLPLSTSYPSVGKGLVLDNVLLMYVKINSVLAKQQVYKKSLKKKYLC